jgi:hypothetical protein
MADLEEPRPPGGWNTLERFASSYQRSTTFFRLDPSGSPSASLSRPHSYRPRIPDFEDEIEEHAVADDDEESALLSGRGSRQSTNYRGSEAGQDYEDHFAQFRGSAEGPRRGTGTGEESLYESVRRGSRRASLLGDIGGPELLIKEVEDEAGNIIEVVVGQVPSPELAWHWGLMAEYGGANDIQLD